MVYRMILDCIIRPLVGSYAGARGGGRLSQSAERQEGQSVARLTS